MGRDVDDGNARRQRPRREQDAGEAEVAGGWKLYGEDKYFASNAGLADVAIVTARPEGAPPGPKGIALFLVPRLNDQGQLNYHVRRFKDKSATRAVPSGEVEFDGAQAFLDRRCGVGHLLHAGESHGVAAGECGRGAWDWRARRIWNRCFARRPDRLLASPSSIIRWCVTTSPIWRCARRRDRRCCSTPSIMFDRAWHETPPYSDRYHYARFLSHLTKNRTAEHGAAATQLAMEIFGGLGFLDDFGIARLHRESLVTLIWEGTSNIQALDMLEAMRKKNAHEDFLDEMLPMLKRAHTAEADSWRRTLGRSLKHLVSLDAGGGAVVQQGGAAARGRCGASGVVV